MEGIRAVCGVKESRTWNQSEVKQKRRRLGTEKGKQERKEEERKYEKNKKNHRLAALSGIGGRNVYGLRQEGR